MSARRLRGLQTFLVEHGYEYCYWHWSSDEKKGGAGYAGVALLSKVKQKSVEFGNMLGDPLPKEARVITAEFENHALVGVYSPNSGGMDDPKTLPQRLAFDKALRNHYDKLEAIDERPVLMTGDLNVAPREMDTHRHAHKKVQKKKNITVPRPGFIPGTSEEEIESYYLLLAKGDRTNLWEALKGHSKHHCTWFATRDMNDRRKGLGVRLDHFIGPKSLLNKNNNVHARDIRNMWESGTSDHIPVCLDLEFNKPGVSTRRVMTDLSRRAQQGWTALTNVELPALPNLQETFTMIAKAVGEILTPTQPTDITEEDNIAEVDYKTKPGEGKGTVYCENENTETIHHEEGDTWPASTCFQETFNPLQEGSEDEETNVLSAAAMENENEEMEEGSSPMPFVDMKLKEKGEEHKSALCVKTLIDSGSMYNLLSTKTAMSILGCTENELKKRPCARRLPRLRSANGKIDTASACLEVSMTTADGFYICNRWFFVFDGLPVAAIIGASTNKALRASLNFDTMSWDVKPETNRSMRIPMRMEKATYWHAATALYAKEDTVVEPGTHKIIRTNKRDANPDSVSTGCEATLDIISPAGKNMPVKVGWGVTTSKGDWVQAANPGREPITLKRGQLVAFVHHHDKQWYDVRTDTDVDRWESFDTKFERFDRDFDSEFEALFASQDRGPSGSLDAKVPMSTPNTGADAHTVGGDRGVGQSSIPSGIEEATIKPKQKEHDDNMKPTRLRGSGVNAHPENSRGGTKRKRGPGPTGPEGVLGCTCAAERSEGVTQWRDKVKNMSQKEVEAELSLSPLKDVDLGVPSKLLDEANLNKLKRWIVSRKPTFSEGAFEPLEVVHNAEMIIKTEEWNPLMRSYPYRMNPTDCETCRSQIDE
jgi:exodeoxyribonuclease III